MPYVTDVGSVAADPRTGDIYFATTTVIVRFDEAGTELSSFPLIDVKPSLAVDDLGHVLVGHFSTGNISVLDSAGATVETVTVPDAVRIIDVQVVR